MHELQWVREARARMIRLPGGRTLLTPEIVRAHGFDLTIDDGVTIETQTLHIGRDVRIARGTRIATDQLYLGDMVTVGADCSVVTGELILADGCVFGDRVAIDVAGGKRADSRLLAGPASLIGSWVHINTCRQVVLEARSAIAPGCMFFTHSYWQSVLDGYRASFLPIHIGSDTCVGAGSTVLPGVSVGNGSVVMANSTVIGDVASETAVAGVPARLLRGSIRRPLDDGERRKTLMNILAELAERLTERGARVEPLGDNGYTVAIPDGTTWTILLNEGANTAAPGATDIFISLDAWTTDGGQGTIFDLARSIVVGPESRVAYEVRNALRRYGIRFEPYAWRADFRNGL